MTRRMKDEEEFDSDQIYSMAEANDGSLKTFLMSKNITVTTKTRGGQSLAHIAAKYDNFDALKYILGKEPSLVEQRDRLHCTALHLATMRGSFKAVKFLVEQYNANICHLSGRYRDRTALHAAVEFNHLDILRYFVDERKIDFNRPNPNSPIPPVFLAVRNKHWEVIEYLVEQKHADMTLLKSNSENILFVIVRENFFNLMKYLLDKMKINLDVNWRNRHGETPVHVAAILGRQEILEYLVDEKHARVDVQRVTDKRTPLHYGASRDHYRICRFLVERGADVLCKDAFGDTPVDNAREPSLVEYLKTVARARTRRSVETSPRPPILPLCFNRVQQKSIEYLPGSTQYIDGGAEGTYSQGSVTSASFIENLLSLAGLLMTRIVRSGRETENSASLSPPSSVIQSKISSMAIEAVNSDTTFRK